MRGKPKRKPPRWRRRRKPRPPWAWPASESIEHRDYPGAVVVRFGRLLIAVTHDRKFLDVAIEHDQGRLLLSREAT